MRRLAFVACVVVGVPVASPAAADPALPPTPVITVALRCATGPTAVSGVQLDALVRGAFFQYFPDAELRFSGDPTPGVAGEPPAVWALTVATEILDAGKGLLVRVSPSAQFATLPVSREVEGASACTEAPSCGVEVAQRLLTATALSLRADWRIASEPTSVVPAIVALPVGPTPPRSAPPAPPSRMSAGSTSAIAGGAGSPPAPVIPNAATGVSTPPPLTDRGHPPPPWYQRPLVVGGSLLLAAGVVAFAYGIRDGLGVRAAARDSRRARTYPEVHAAHRRGQTAADRANTAFTVGGALLFGGGVSLVLGASL